MTNTPHPPDEFDVDSDIRAALAEALREGKARRGRQRIAAYVLIVLVAAWGFWQTEQTQDQLCAGTTETRGALRDVVKGIRQLGEDLVLDGKPEPTTYKEAADVARLKFFADQQLARLELPVCER